MAARQTYDQGYVRSMFNKIAPHYDFLNHFLSLGVDIRWRKKAVKLLRQPNPGIILDLATGTGDLAIEASSLPVEKIIGVDLSPEMLGLAQRKIRRLGLDTVIALEEGTAESLRFADATFGAVMVAFGIRNFSNLNKGLGEMFRVLRPGGKAIILEFSKPESAPFRQIYSFYFTKILPRIGGSISRSREAYRYLPSTVREFPDAAQLAEILASEGFVHIGYNSLTLGIVTLYHAEKPLSNPSRP